LCALTFFVALAFAAPPLPPVWPKQYEATGVFSLPYGYGIHEPFMIAYDGVNNRAKLSYYHGMDEYIYRYDTNMTYMIVPRIDTLTCFASAGSASQFGPLQTVLPDLTGWQWVSDKDGIRDFQKNVTSLGRKSVYTMSVRLHDGAPHRLVLEGYDFLFGSHPDLYIMRYHSYRVGVKAFNFEVPRLCDKAHSSPRTSARAEAMTGLIRSIVDARDSSHSFDAFLAQHKKAYTPEEYQTRQSTWKRNQKLIETFNLQQTASYSLKMNHFGDMEHDEFKYLMLPLSVKSSPRPTFETQYVHPEPTPEQVAALPTEVDWRKKGAVTMVKDQGVCGSCWTFGTTGSLEGMWASKYGRLVSISEQQIVDCAWTNAPDGQGDSACDGGFAAPAFQWIMDNKGIALEEDYPYLMVDSWCNAAIKSSDVQVKSYVNVTMNSEHALQDAVARLGPVSVAIDAAHEHFEYYSSGVYYNPKCQNGINDLDHEVLVVGYGTENGQDYWIVKNSWSTHWGDEGYIKMARNRGNNCGIATCATYPIV